MSAQKIIRKKFYAAAFGLGFLFISCKQIDLFEKNTVIHNYEWAGDFNAKGSFSITDTASLYNIYLVIRHTDAYKYNNIWLKIGFQAPGDTMHYQRLNLQLANDMTGWEGSGMNDIWELRKMLNSQPEPFKKAGNYSFTISQNMRDNPLLHVMSVGLRVERQKME